MPTDWSFNLATGAPCLLFTLLRVDGEVEFFTSANHDITIGDTTWTPQAGLRPGAKTARIDGTPPTMGFEAQASRDGPPLYFRDIVRGKYEGSYVTIELASQDNPATRDFIFAGRIFGTTTYNQRGNVLLDLISEFAIPRGILIEKFTLMCRWDFGQWNTCGVPVFPHDTFPFGGDAMGADPPPRSAPMTSGSWRRFRFGSAGTPEDFHNVILMATCTPNPTTTPATMPAFSDVVGATTNDGPTVVWTTRDAYARAAKVVSVDRFTVTLDRLPDPRWNTTLKPERLKFVFYTGEYKGRAFKGANWNSDTNSFETYLPCPLAAVDDWIEISPECNKTLTMCHEHFANTYFFGGFPYQQGAKAQAQQLGYV